MSKRVKHETDTNTPKRSAFSIFREEFKKEFDNNNSDNWKLSFAAGERGKLLSDSDKAPYVLMAQKLKGKMSVENGEEDEFEEFDKSMADKSEFDKSESDKLESVKHEQGSNSLKVNGDNTKTETYEDEDELKTIITEFARFVEPLKPIAPPKDTNSQKHLDELKKLISLPLETLLSSANLIQLQNIIKLSEDLKDNIESLERQLVEAEAEKAKLIQLKGDFVSKHQKLIQLEGDLVSKHQKLKRARIMCDDLAPLIEKNAVIGKIIVDCKNAVKNIDCCFNALIVQLNVLRNAA